MARRKRKPESDSAADIGIVMTVSLFLILLTFFILLNSIAVLDERRVRMSIGSILGAFGSLPGGLSPMKTGDTAMSPSAPMMENDHIIEDLLSLLEKPLPGQITVSSGPEQETLCISEKVLFHPGTLKLKTTAYPLLNKLGRLIKKGDFPVEIIGHTDGRPGPEKGYGSNWELSALRAIQVLKYMVRKGGVSPERLAAYGRGSQKPMVSDGTRASRAQNRRVEIVLNFKEPAVLKRIYGKRPSGFFTYKKFDFRIF